MHEANIVQLTHICLSGLLVGGFEIEVTTSIEDFEERLACAEKLPNHPMISPSWHDFSPTEVFALVFRVDGQDIGGVAARFIDLGESSLADHWARSYKRLYGGMLETPVHNFSSIPRNEISGRIVYLGELFLKQEFRDRSLNWRAVFHYLFSLCFLRWRPDWIYGFVRQKDVLDGKASRYGFTRQHVGPQEWITSKPRRSSSEYLVAVPRRDFHDAAAFYARNPAALNLKQEVVRPESSS